MLGFPTSIGADGCATNWGGLRLRQGKNIRSAAMKAPTAAPQAMPPIAPPDRCVAGVAVALALAVSIRLVEDVMV
jgi:hypothetical protein